MISVFIFLLLFALLGGCASFPTDEVERQHFEKHTINAKPFLLFTMIKEERKGAPWSIFIEGDGHAWRSRTQASNDPTPQNPIALQLALRDKTPNRLYLARPCQYVKNDACTSKYWTSHRFAPEVLDAMNSAIDQITGTTPKHLIGYSGGGAIAALLAARRSDILDLTTYAGNLDSDAFTAYHQVSPLTGSLDPIDSAQKLETLPQIHYVGSKDKVTPPFLAERFVNAQKENNCAFVVVIEGAGHETLPDHTPDGLQSSTLSCKNPIKEY